MIPTRQKILDYLREHHQSTAPEMSRALNTTRENIRYHLGQLLEEGLIEMVPAAPGSARGRGRPVQLYRPSDRLRPNNLLQLASVLLDAFLPDGEPPDQHAAHIDQLADALAGSAILPKNLTQRLNRVVQELNQKRYQARWEARPQGPLVMFRSCPYAALLPEHPELCQVDTHLLARLVGQPVEMTARMDPLTGHPPACLFFVRPGSPRPSAVD